MGAFSVIGALFHVGALALLILGTITSPVTQSLMLAQDGDYQFGVFGYCNTARGNCSSASSSYQVSQFSKKKNYLFDDDKRNQFEKILIIFPIACGLTFFSFIIALINVRKSRSILLSIISIILAVLSFIGASLACIFTFLTFYPNIKWCSWIQIGSAILNLIALVFMIINLKISNTSDDITSMDGETNEYSLKNNLIDDDENNNNNTTFAMPPQSQFNNSTFKSPLNINSSDESSSITERKSINDITVQQNKYLSSNSALTSNSQQQQQQLEPNIYAGPMGSSTRNQAPNVVPEIAETQREPTLPQIGNPYLSTQESLPNNLTVGDDRNILRAGQDEYIDPHLDDNNSLEANSDFTSVSQRAVNPKYYRGASNLPPNQPMYPQQQQQYGPPHPPPPQQQFGPPPQQYMIQQNPYTNTAPPPPLQQQQQQQQYRPRHGRRPSKPNASDMILQNNPDFMLGQGVARKQMTRYGQLAPVQQVPRLGQNYKNRGLKNQLPPASLTKDSPYGSFM